jgi:lysozyme family protein
MNFLNWILGFLHTKPGNTTPPPGPPRPVRASPVRPEEPKVDKFDRAMEFTLRWEGGLVDHAADPGGLTNFGIAQRSHPGVDIRNLTEELAKEIYREKYWDKVHGDDLAPAVALAVMDYAVNSGTGRAAKTIQKVVGATVDGAIGPNTLKKIKAAVEADGENAVAQAVVMERVGFLCRLVKNKPEMIVFLHGWMKRTHQCMAEVSK